MVVSPSSATRITAGSSVSMMPLVAALISSRWPPMLPLTATAPVFGPASAGASAPRMNWTEPERWLSSTTPSTHAPVGRSQVWSGGQLKSEVHVVLIATMACPLPPLQPVSTIGAARTIEPNAAAIDAIDAVDRKVASFTGCPRRCRSPTRWSRSSRCRTPRSRTPSIRRSSCSRGSRGWCRRRSPRTRRAGRRCW